jgi:aryl-alcohol dehydrogenase-like predicted oxidoreductase
MGLLSGKYKPSEAGRDGEGEGRLQAVKSMGLPSLMDKFTPRNWAIVAEVEQVARESGLSMAQVALQWAARQPALGSVILGARNLPQFEDNLAALERPLDAAAMHRLDAVSGLPPQFPYSFFEPSQQVGIHGGVGVGDKPAGYAPPVWIDTAPTPVFTPESTDAR